MGIGSGSQIILDNVDKKLNLDQVKDAIRLLTDQGIYCEGGFVVGYSGETAETFSETFDLINSTGLPLLPSFPVILFQKLVYYESEKKAEGIL